jgi:hypothetical protein
MSCPAHAELALSPARDRVREHARLLARLN